MNLKTILIAALLFVVLVGLISFCYATYAVYGETSAAGSAIVAKHQLMFYIVLACNISSLVLGGGILYMG